jgi:hypothetical protein
MEPIKVWVFEDAPAELQALSNHGGDEDWLVLVPKDSADKIDEWTGWIMRLDTCDEPSKHVLENGDVVYIGAHA